jgi:hypothetical protein
LKKSREPAFQTKQETLLFQKKQKRRLARSTQFSRNRVPVLTWMRRPAGAISG